MERSHGNDRAGSATAFGTSIRSTFGAFSSQSPVSNLSYIAEPPDLSGVSDRNVVVSFKNLLKKDSTTKAKALEDLVEYVKLHPYEQNGGAEDPILDAWVHVYPRTSIDNSRRVRSLSHTLQAELLSSTRKRAERHIPRIVGPWLAGTFDKDRVVSRAAKEGLTYLLTTDEKVLLFWKKCHGEILKYATAALQETPDSLSDGRSTTTEDAQEKYDRVLHGSLCLVHALLEKLEASEIAKQRTNYVHIFSEEAVWEGALAKDSAVRKAVFQLISICLDSPEEFLKSPIPERLRRIMVVDSLRAPQAGSAAELVRTLTKFTIKHPEIWKSPKNQFVALFPLLERGSQGSPAVFWQHLDELLDVFPKQPTLRDQASDMLRAMRMGISGREEPRTSAMAAWSCYLNSVERTLGRPSSNSSGPFLRQNLFPLTVQYLHSTPDTLSFTTGGQLPLLLRAWKIVTQSEQAEVRDSGIAEWQRLADDFLGRVSNSLPDSSTDFGILQQALAGEGNRWFTLVGALFHDESSPEARSSSRPSEGPSLKLLDGTAALLLRRNFKPFGAASVLESALTQAPFLFKNPDISTVASLLPSEDDASLHKALTSPSASHLVRCVNALGSIPEQHSQFSKLWTSVAQCLTRLEADQSSNLMAALISNPVAVSMARQEPSLQEFLQSKCLQCAQGSCNDWELFEAVFGFEVLEASVSENLIRQIVSLLEPAGNQNSAIRALEIVIRKQPGLISSNNTLQLDLVGKLLGMMEISDPTVSARATGLRLMIEKQYDGEPLVGIIQENLENAGEQSLEIETILQQAIILSKRSATVLEDLFPNTHIWMSELAPFLHDEPNASLSLTSVVGGAFFLSSENHAVLANTRPRRDRKGLSIAARMALYTSKLLSSGIDISSLPHEFQTELLFLLPLSVELASDQLTLMNDNKLFATLSPNIQDQIEDFVSSSRKVINSIAASATGWRSGKSGPVVDELIQLLLQQARQLSPVGLHSSCVLSGLLMALTEAHGAPSGLEDWISRLGVMKVSDSTAFGAVALLTGFGTSLSSLKLVNNFCNRLVSDVAGANIQSDKTLLSLVLLNSCLSLYPVDGLPVAINRVVFAVKQITVWTKTPDNLNYRLSTEICRSLRRLLPCVKEVYGPYWERTIKFCIYLWNNVSRDSVDDGLPYLHASMKLMSALEAMTDANDDLEEAIASHAEEASLALLELLKLPRSSKSQPSQIVDETLRRRIDRIPLKYLKDLSDLYGLVASDFREVQTAAFGLLHRALPAAQEQLSVDVLLDDREANLPVELLSLLLDPPTLEAYPDDVLTSFPLAIRSYLLSWHLVFDAFEKASHKVRADYTTNLKAANHLRPLLEFTVDVLGHSAGHPIKLDREGITEEHIRAYDIDPADGEPAERNMHWLLVHLFFRTLKFVPGLFRSWFLDCRAKQTSIAVESWVTRYFSPLLIADTLDEVASWAAAQEPPADDEKELVVKVSRAAREITAGYEVDEVDASIAIKVPASYPVEGVSVVGVNRVAVTEKKWQSWLTNTQGVITFSNGSVVDGLAAFRRNIVGALKGQTECAICYSIVSTEKRMPDKRCGTCRNLFHRSCLYKWFQNSNQNTCPLCRNLIDYLGSETKAKRGT